jgi:hypothetical protein
VIPWQFNESYPNAWCTCAVDYDGNPRPAYYGGARAYRGAPSARFATCAWGREAEARAFVSGPARFVDLGGSVIAELQGGEIVARLDAFSSDVFLLDLEGRNRYVMTRTRALPRCSTCRRPRSPLSATTTVYSYSYIYIHLRRRPRWGSCSRTRARTTRPAGSCSRTT